MPALDTRSYVGRYFALTLDGYEPAGFLKSIEGGGIKGELIAQQLGGQPWRVKHINNPTIEPVTVSVPFSMSSSFMDWVKKSWAGEVERRSGSIITYDYNMIPVHEWQFTEALILETAIPTLDGQSKEPAYITVKFQAETGEHKFNPGGSKMQVISPSTQSKWLPCNFKFEIDGLDVKRVAKIDGFTVKQNVKPMSCGPSWMYQIEPTSLEYPNLTAYVSMVSAQPFFDWHKDFVVGGNNPAGNEKTGAITLLNSTLTEELLTIDLKAVGIVNIVVDKGDTGQDSVKRAKVELYCEEMSFNFPG